MTPVETPLPGFPIAGSAIAILISLLICGAIRRGDDAERPRSCRLWGRGFDRHQLSMPNCVSTQWSLTLARDETAGRRGERLTYKTQTFGGRGGGANARGWGNREDQR